MVTMLTPANVAACYVGRAVPPLAGVAVPSACVASYPVYAGYVGPGVELVSSRVPMVSV